MKNVVTVKDLIKVVESVQKENQVVQRSLEELRQILKCLNPRAAIDVSTQGIIPPRIGYKCQVIGLGKAAKKQK